ncbi:MAG: 6-phospho-beta-glucosidase, partial [Propionibacterium sp.]
PKLLDRPDLIESFEEGRLFGAELIQALGCIPNEYLHYYYYSRDYLNADQATEQTRGVFLEAQQSRFYDGLGGTESALTLWENTRLEREATYMATNRAAAGSFEREESDLQSGGYDKVALAIMHAIANDVPAELILNVANNGLIAGLADDAVVEVPCLVDGRGVRPLAQPSLPEHAQGMVINAKYVERCTIEAAVNQSRNAALLALLHHRLIDSFTVANDLLDDLVKNFPELSYLQENANV